MMRRGDDLKRFVFLWPYLLLGVSLVLSGCSPESTSQDVESYLAVSLSLDSNNDLEPIQPIPLTISLDQQKVRLGDRLFHDPRLSHDNTIACSSCHDLTKGGTDQAYRSTGIKGAIGGINTPTVFNSGLNIRQFWDGRANTLEDQIDGPTQHPAEMGSTWPEIIGKLQQDESYAKDFSTIYADGMTAATIKNAIATFEHSLLTPHSRFDQYLRGEQDAITSLEKRGYALFKNYGCVACHQGANVGGNLFQQFGLFTDKDTGDDRVDRSPAKTDDHENHRHMVKVPSLRVAVLTPPYFHDGSAATLPDAVRKMARVQLGRHLTEKEIAAIVAFLYTLPGQYQGHDL
ncbi:cytochrome-c peroxidase [Candidatus Nitrospira salsa]